MKVSGEEFLDQLDDEQWVSLSGITRVMFDYLWKRYLAGMPLQRNTRYSWFQLFYWLRNYPTWRVLSSFGFRSKSSVESSILQQLYLLESAMKKDDILGGMWKKRNDIASPCDEFFDGHVIGSFDSVPVTIQRSKTRKIQKSTYVPKKYARHILKWQFAVGWSGIPIYMYGPLNGTASDIECFRKRGCGPLMADDERLLADKGYVGENHYLIVPYKEYKQRTLPMSHQHHNTVLSWFRAGVEHFFGHLKKWDIIGTRYRGHVSTSVAPLSAAVYVITCILAIRIESRPLRIHKPLVLPSESDSDSDIDTDRGCEEVADIDGKEETKEMNCESTEFDIDSCIMGMYDFDVIMRDGRATGRGPEPSDADINTGKRSIDFKMKDRVLVWWWGKWWHAIVTYVYKKTDQVSVRFRWSKTITSHYKSRLVYPFNWED